MDKFKQKLNEFKEGYEHSSMIAESRTDHLQASKTLVLIAREKRRTSPKMHTPTKLSTDQPTHNNNTNHHRCQ